jgi:hypothetical protein
MREGVDSLNVAAAAAIALTCCGSAMSLDVVFFDIGGVIYTTLCTSGRAARLRDLGAEVTDEETRPPTTPRRAQSGSFRDGLAERFLPGDVDRETVTAHVSRYWANAPEALLPDVRPAWRCSATPATSSAFSRTSRARSCAR